MHEYGLCDDILDAVRRRAAGRRVSAVKVRIGTLHHVVDEAFQQAFEHVSLGTEAEAARLELVVLPVLQHCVSCGGNWETDRVDVTCPKCSGMDIEYRGGDELILESIEVDAEQPPAEPALEVTRATTPAAER